MFNGQSTALKLLWNFAWTHFYFKNQKSYQIMTFLWPKKPQILSFFFTLKTNETALKLLWNVEYRRGRRLHTIIATGDSTHNALGHSQHHFPVLRDGGALPVHLLTSLRRMEEQLVGSQRGPHSGILFEHRRGDDAAGPRRTPIPRRVHSDRRRRRVQRLSGRTALPVGYSDGLCHRSRRSQCLFQFSSTGFFFFFI